MNEKYSLGKSCNIVENVFYSLKGRISDSDHLPNDIKDDMLQFMLVAEPHLKEILKYIRENTGE